MEAINLRSYEKQRENVCFMFFSIVDSVFHERATIFSLKVECKVGVIWA